MIAPWSFTWMLTSCRRVYVGCITSMKEGFADRKAALALERALAFSPIVNFFLMFLSLNLRLRSHNHCLPLSLLARTITTFSTSTHECRTSGNAIKAPSNINRKKNFHFDCLWKCGSISPAGISIFCKQFRVTLPGIEVWYVELLSGFEAKQVLLTWGSLGHGNGDFSSFLMMVNNHQGFPHLHHHPHFFQCFPHYILS